MTHERFERMLVADLERTREVMSSKSKEYSTEEDKLHNFKVAARVKGETPEKALWGMLAKHFVSVLDLVEDPESVRRRTREYLDEKFGDSINYLELLKALLIERMESVSEGMCPNWDGGHGDE